MTGPEHYREAEQLLATVQRFPESSDAAVLATAAQTHATLAVAAAVALGGPVAATVLDEQPDLEEWIKVAGVKPS